MTSYRLPIRPIHGQILVRQDKTQERRASGLYIPQGHRDTYPDLATVLAVGPGEIGNDGNRIPMEVVVGDRILFTRRAGTALNPDNREVGRPEFQDMLMLDEDDIVGIVEDEA